MFQCMFSFIYWHVLHKEKQSCKNCDYMRLMTAGYDEGKWKCCASCGNNEGIVCSAWFPRSLCDKWRNTGEIK